MNQGTINFVLQQMTSCLNNSQMIRLQNTLNESLKLAEDRSTEMSSAELLEAFLAVKRLEGRSDKTLALYRCNIGMILDVSEKNACVMTTDDIRKCLALYQEVYRITAENIERVDRKPSIPYTIGKIRKLIGAGRKTQVHLMAGKFLAFPVFRRI